VTYKGRTDTIEVRRRKRAAINKRNGHEPGYAEEALDLYLSGEHMAEIAEAFDIGIKTMRISIAHAALWRLLEAGGASTPRDMSTEQVAKSSALMREVIALRAECTALKLRLELRTVGAQA